MKCFLRSSERRRSIRGYTWSEQKVPKNHINSEDVSDAERLLLKLILNTAPLWQQAERWASLFILPSNRTDSSMTTQTRKEIRIGKREM